MIFRIGHWFFLKRIALIAFVSTVGVVLVGYYPSIKVGFLGDDWWFLGKAASLNLPDYLAFYFDPRAQIFWYRPLYGILLLGEYFFFGATPDGYHIGQIVLHALNCLLLSGIVWQYSKRWRLAFLAGLFYALVPVNNLAVFWIAVQDPLAMVFYLAAIWSWIVYLQSARTRFYWLAFGGFVLALLGKEASVFLVVTLFLIDRWLMAKPTKFTEMIRRYALWAVTFVAYLALEYRVQTTAYFPNRWGYGLGWHVLENLAHYAALVVFPWIQDGVLIYVVLAVLGGAWIAFLLWHKSRLAFFLGVQAGLTFAPALAFPTMFFQARYLYFASAITAMVLAMVCEWIARRAPRDAWASAAVLALVIIAANGWVTLTATAEQVEAGRQMRVPLRDIYQQHPTFPPDTYLYFVEPPYPMIMRNLSGMFLLKYGTGLSVWSNDAEWGGVDENRFADLRAHKNSFVYLFDSNGTRHEIAVGAALTQTTSPILPTNFQAPIRLEGYEVTRTTFKRGSENVLLLYWRSIAPISRDYTVFVHLINAQGEIVWSEDMSPRGGKSPTTDWKPGRLVVDAHLVTIPADVSPGTYRLEVGMYYLPTLERLSLVDDAGRVVADQVTIASFEIVE